MVRWPSYFKWSNWKSHDRVNPDSEIFQITDIELFPTSVSLNARVNHKDSDGKWSEKILPIKYNDSWNRGLLQEWEDAFHKGWLKVNGRICIKTWLEKSKRHRDRVIRRFRLIIID